MQAAYPPQQLPITHSNLWPTDGWQMKKRNKSKHLQKWCFSGEGLGALVHSDEVSLQINANLFWVIAFVRWWNTSILRGALPRRMVMISSENGARLWAVTDVICMYVWLFHSPDLHTVRHYGDTLNRHVVSTDRGTLMKTDKLQTCVRRQREIIFRHKQSDVLNLKFKLNMFTTVTTLVEPYCMLTLQIFQLLIE